MEANRRHGIARGTLVTLTVVLIVVGGISAVVLLGGERTRTNSTTQAGGSVVISLGQTPKLLGPGITMNYTVTLIPSSGAKGEAMLSAETPPGLVASIDQNGVNLTRGDVAVDLSVHASDGVSPGEYGVGIKVEWQGGSSNFIFEYRVVQHLVLLLGGSTGPGNFFPSTVSAKVGETVTWLSVDPGSDEYGGQRSVRIVELNQASPTLNLFGTWAFTFTASGTYDIQDPLNSVLVPDGTITVS